MASPINGILLVDKNEGESSHDVVGKVKRALGLKKAGHAGTLDPFATGMLILLLGQGTKLSSFLMQTHKVYQATMRLGVETDTLDLTGQVVRNRPVPDLSPELIQETAHAFTGEIEQIPPIFSALKHNGTRAYKLARKGQDVVLKKRSVFIRSFDILSVKLPEVTFRIACGSGTYIRSLARDLGEALGTGGHLISLRRLSVGSFDVEDALASADILNGDFKAFCSDKVISLKEALPGFPEINVSPVIAEKIRQGSQSVLEGIAEDMDMTDCDGTHFKITSNDELVSVAKLNKSRRGSHGRLEIVRVFI